jgi:putative transposase
VPRQPRAEYESGVHHVYARGNRRQAIYVDDADRQRYLALLERVTVWMRWRCLAYCLMGNHVHLLVETREPNLGRGIQRLHGTYALNFNRRHGHSGHLFQDRFGAVRIQSDPQLWVAAAYIARNPVDAGLCREVADWPWSSYAAVIDRPPPDWLDIARLLSYFTGHGGDAWERYTEFVEALAIQPRT